MIIFNVQRAITPKVGKPGLQLMCFARRFIVLCICVKFPENILKVFNLQCVHKYMVETTLFTVQRTITPKRGKPELQFMYSACHPHGACVCEVG